MAVQVSWAATRAVSTYRPSCSDHTVSVGPVGSIVQYDGQPAAARISLLGPRSNNRVDGECTSTASRGAT
ncbi:hypothetical protein D9M69_692230 [compost metagenome]